jgi:hypothetical protein
MNINKHVGFNMSLSMLYIVVYTGKVNVNVFALHSTSKLKVDTSEVQV